MRLAERRAMLFNPDFWRILSRQMPPFSCYHEDAMLAALARSTRVSPERARAHYERYLSSYGDKGSFDPSRHRNDQLENLPMADDPIKTKSLTDQRRKLWETLNSFIGQQGGWVVSPPGEKHLRVGFRGNRRCPADCLNSGIPCEPLASAPGSRPVASCRWTLFGSRWGDRRGRSGCRFRG